MKKRKKRDIRLIIAAGFVLISQLGWIIPVFVVPWLKLSFQAKALVITGCIIFGNVTYGIGFFLAGARVIALFKEKKLGFKAFKRKLSR